MKTKTYLKQKEREEKDFKVRLNYECENLFGFFFNTWLKKKYLFKDSEWNGLWIADIFIVSVCVSVCLRCSVKKQ